eukprot:6541982-Prymnesium_polylepis.2
MERNGSLVVVEGYTGSRDGCTCSQRKQSEQFGSKKRQEAGFESGRFELRAGLTLPPALLENGVERVNDRL